MSTEHEPGLLTTAPGDRTDEPTAVPRIPGPRGPSGTDGTSTGTKPSGWVLRVIVSVHLVAIFGQPVFAGVYLSGDFAALNWHAIGANIVTFLGYAQVVAAVVVWIRLRQSWLFGPSLGLALAETVQYYAGMHGQLWLHLPLGVLTIVGLVLQFIAVWRRPLRRPAAAREESAGA